MAHYGLYIDWIQDLKMLAGNDILKDLSRGPEAYLQMWERAYGVKANACTTPSSKLSPTAIKSRVKAGMTSWQTLAGRRPAGPPAGQHVHLLLHRRHHEGDVLERRQGHPGDLGLRSYRGVGFVTPLGTPGRQPGPVVCLRDVQGRERRTARQIGSDKCSGC